MTAIALVTLMILGIAPSFGLYLLAQEQGGTTIIINDEVVAKKEQGILEKDGQVFIVVRKIFEAFGFNVEWDENTRAVNLTYSGSNIVLAMNSNVFLINNRLLRADAPLQIVDGGAVISLDTFLRIVGEFYTPIFIDNALIFNTIPMAARPLTLTYRGELFSTREEILAKTLNIAPFGVVNIANSTFPSENFMFGFDSIGPNVQTRRLIFDGLETMASNMHGQWFANPIVNAEDIQITDNEDGSRTYLFTIHTTNQFSDGRFITAHDYVGWIALQSSDYFWNLGLGRNFTHIAGSFEFGVGASQSISGLRLISDSQFSVTVTADSLPNVWEDATLMNYSPFPLHAVIPNFNTQEQIVDNGEGVFITGITQRQVEVGIFGGRYGGIFVEQGFNFHPTVSVGPYQFLMFDLDFRDIVLEVNPYFPGTWDGYRPRIEHVVLYQTNDFADAIRFGEVDAVFELTNGWVVEDLLWYNERANTHRHIEYTRNGFSMIRFHVDHGPTQFLEVRQALSWLIDREWYLEGLQNGRGTAAFGPYTTAQWFTREAIERGMHEHLTLYTYDPQKAVEILEAGGWVLNYQGLPFGTSVDAPNFETPHFRDLRGSVRYKDVTDIVQSPNSLPFIHDPSVIEVDGRLLMRLELQWATAHDGMNFITDFLYWFLVYDAFDIGIQITPHRFDNFLGHISRSVNFEQEFHMFNQGVTFARIYSPWYTYDPNLHGWSNITFTSNPEIFEAANRLQFIDISTPEGRDEFVEAYIEYIIIANREVLEIPLFVNSLFDFIPYWLQNWHNNSLWGFTNAIVRAYIER